MESPHLPVHKLVESAGDQLSKDMAARADASGVTMASAATIVAARSGPHTPVSESPTVAADGAQRGGCRYTTAELLWALARSEKRRTALEEQLRALKALPAGLASSDVLGKTALMSPENSCELQMHALAEHQPSRELQEDVARLNETQVTTSDDSQDSQSYHARPSLTSSSDAPKLERKAAAAQRPFSAGGGGGAGIANRLSPSRTQSRRGLGSRSSASHNSAAAGSGTPPWALIVGGSGNKSTSSRSPAPAGKAAADQQPVAPFGSGRSPLTVNVPAGEDLPQELALKRQAADMAGAGEVRTENEALISNSHNEGLLEPLPEYTAVCMPLSSGSSEERRDELSRRTSSADRGRRRQSAGASMSFGSSQRSHSNESLESGGLQAEISRMPAKIAVQLRRGFSRLTTEVRSLRARHEQQLVNQHVLRAQIVSREALNDRLGALEAEKMAYGEWVSLRDGFSQDGYAEEIDDKRKQDLETLMQQAQVLAQELYEQHLMLKEDLLSEQFAHCEYRVSPGQLCEELCVLLHHCEEALRVALEEEGNLRRSLQSEVRASLPTEPPREARQSRFGERNGTPSRTASSDLRLLHQKLANLKKQDQRRGPYRDRRTL